MSRGILRKRFQWLSRQVHVRTWHPVNASTARISLRNLSFSESVLARGLKSSGAVLIEGVKASGKTETATRIARSAARFDTDPDVAIKMDIDPHLLLEGDTPRLLDEWQLFPGIWDFTRREVDARKEKGQFVLTGSATPDDKARRHSGAGRFSVMRMRPMSWFERGWSSGEVSLTSLLETEVPRSSDVEISIPSVCEHIALGGWPGLIGEDADAALRCVLDEGLDHVFARHRSAHQQLAAGLSELGLDLLGVCLW